LRRERRRRSVPAPKFVRNRLEQLRFLQALPNYQSNRTRTLWRAARWRARCLLHMSPEVKLSRWSSRIYLPAEPHVGSTSIFLFRENYEPELSYLDRVLKPGDVFIDAGANIGIYSVAASHLVGDSGYVLAFEPAEVASRLLRQNLELNHVQNTKVFKQALAERAGRGRLYHVYVAGTYSLGGTGRPDEGFEEVELTTIDEVVREERIGRVSCIKVDVEGAEELVLRGAKDTLQHSRPTVIFELNRAASDRLGLAYDGAVTLLRQHGYRFDLVEGGGLVEMTDWPDGRNVLARCVASAF
jgi:FkbM family methyltransferase